MGEELGNVVEGDQDTDDTLVVDEPEVVVVEQPAGDSTDDPNPTDAAADSASVDEGEGLVVTLGDEGASEDGEDDGGPADKDAPAWVGNLRIKNRQQTRRIRELEKKLRTAAPEQPAAPTVGEKPTLAACDYDEDKFGAELEAWHGRKTAADQQQRTKNEADERERARWQTRVEAVTTAGAALKVQDFDEASAAFEDTFSPIQQGIIVGAPDDPKTSALLRYALGRSPKKAKELAAIADPVKFTWAIANLEKQMKVSNVKAAPAPDRVVRGSSAGAAAVDNRLARLREEAERTGDSTKVVAYRAQQRAAAKK